PDVLSAIAAAFSALGALVAIPVALAANRISRRALALSENQANNQEASLVVHIIDAFASVTAERDRDIVVSVLITNPSNSPTAIARAELDVEYVVEDNLMHLLLQALDGSSFLRRDSSRSLATVTVLFEPHGAASQEFL